MEHVFLNPQRVRVVKKSALPSPAGGVGGVARFEDFEPILVGPPVVPVPPRSSSPPPSGRGTPQGTPTPRQPPSSVPIQPTAGSSGSSYPEQAPGKHVNTGFDFSENIPNAETRPPWMDTQMLAYGAWMRNLVVQFAKTMAGKLNFTSVNRVIETGFEDISRLTRQTQSRPSDLRMPSAATAINFYGAETQAPNQELYEFEQSMQQFTATLRLNASDALRVMHYLGQRTSRRNAAYDEWLTLPMNLNQRYAYFTPPVQAGIETAVARLSEYFPEIAQPALFGYILLTDGREDFAELVKLAVRLNNYDGRVGNKTQHERIGLEQRMNTQVSRLTQRTLRQVEVPPLTTLEAAPPTTITRLSLGSVRTMSEQLSFNPV